MLTGSEYEGSEQVFVGNGQGMDIEHIGKYCLISKSSKSAFTLQDLLHVPSITKNLISVSKFARDNKVFFEFHPNECFVQSQVSKETFLQGILSNSLLSDKHLGPAPTHIGTRGANTKFGIHVLAPISNVHPMRTRTKLGVFIPKTYANAVAGSSIDLVHHQPTSVAQALSSPHWKQAMDEEVAALARNQTWTLVPPSSAASRFSELNDIDGIIQKYKARLVAKQFHQKEGLDFDQVFSPVVKPSTVRVMLSIAFSKSWSIRQFDFINTFLNGDLQEHVYMQQPEGFESSDPNLVCKLRKALYGLKQAPRAWFTKLSSTLHQFGFNNSKSAISLLTKFTTSSTTYILCKLMIFSSQAPMQQKSLS